jgi:hypothetical protein
MVEERAQSALNLRLALALFGLVVLGIGAALLARAGYSTWALIAGAVALVALVNAIVVQRRRIQRRRRSPGAHYSLFE